MVERLPMAAGETDGKVQYENPQARFELVEEPAQAVKLRRIDRAAGVPGPAVAGRRVDADEPDRPHGLREGIAMLADAPPLLPGSEVAFEVSRRRGTLCAVVMIPRNRQARDRQVVH